MPDLRERADELGRQFLAHARTQHQSTLIVKLVLVVGAAGIAAVVQCVEVARAVGEISGWTWAGIAATFLVGIGGIFVIYTEPDASLALEGARRAVEDARALEREMERYQQERDWFEKETLRCFQLYSSMDGMRGAMEQSLDVRAPSAASIIQTALEAAHDALLDAFDFQARDIWTICVFEAQKSKESDKVLLRCIAHIRKIPCSIDQARTWPEGVGVAGIAYSMNTEKIIEDMGAPELRAIFEIADNVRAYDSTRYRSMVAVPISIGARTVPWGVAVATSDKAHHFQIVSDGVSTAEPIRAVAAMAALAVKAVEVAGTSGAAPATNAAKM